MPRSLFASGLIPRGLLRLGWASGFDVISMLVEWLLLGIAQMLRGLRRGFFIFCECFGGLARLEFPENYFQFFSRDEADGNPCNMMNLGYEGKNSAVVAQLDRAAAF